MISINMDKLQERTALHPKLCFGNIEKQRGEIFEVTDF